MKEKSMNEEETEKLKDLKAVYSGAIQSGEIGIANMIKGGIDLIEKLQKENEEFKRLHIQDNKHLDFIMQHCIPVQKVKDKIEEILNNGEYRIIFEGDAEFPDEATCIDAQKYIKLEKLQELLEGRE